MVTGMDSCLTVQDKYDEVNFPLTLFMTVDSWGLPTAQRIEQPVEAIVVNFVHQRQEPPYFT